MTSKRTLSTHIIEGDRPTLQIDEVELKVSSGPDKGTTVLLGTDPIRIGSAHDCELALHDRSVSSYHAEVSIAEGRYWVRDLKSKNGLFVGGFEIARAPLCDGMKLNLGTTVIQIRALGHQRSISLAPAGLLGRLCAHSVAMRATAAKIKELAPSSLNILIEGETGTGKEVAAEALHALSTRAHGPLVILDCGAVQPSIIAAELFGHEKGAFSGADKSRAGLFEEADGGTLFIDEIGELPLDVQPMLLGAIDRKTSRRVGGQRQISHDVRIIAATNRNLVEEVRARRFREDLFFRLSVARFRLPPLRQRREDIAPLAHQFAKEFGVTLSPDLLALFTAYDWPGNVRDLRAAVARLSANLSPFPDPPEPSAGGWHEDRRASIEQFERNRLVHLLKEAEGNMARAAELGGVSRQFLHRMVIKYGLHPSDHDD